MFFWLNKRTILIISNKLWFKFILRILLLLYQFIFCFLTKFCESLFYLPPPFFIVWIDWWFEYILLFKNQVFFFFLFLNQFPFFLFSNSQFAFIILFKVLIIQHLALCLLFNNFQYFFILTLLPQLIRQFHDFLFVLLMI